MSSIRIEDGLIELDDKRLSAVVSSISVNNEVVWKEQTMLLESGNEKIFNGFQDAQIDIALTIYEEHDGGKNRFEDREVVFSYMTTMMVDDTLQVNITFKENNPKVSAVQKQQSGASVSDAPAEAEWAPVSDAEARSLEEVGDSIR